MLSAVERLGGETRGRVSKTFVRLRLAQRRNRMMSEATVWPSAF